MCVNLMKFLGKKIVFEDDEKVENKGKKKNPKIKIQRRLVVTKVTLKVIEAQQDDAYKGIIRMDSEFMKKLRVKRGDSVMIKGKRETVAIVDKAYPADVGEEIIRMDGIIRRNAKTKIGEMVHISKAEIREAKKIIIAPVQKNIMVQAEPKSLESGLLGRAVVKGDVVVLGGVQRRKDLLSEEFGEEFGDMFGDMFGNMGFGQLGGFTQIKFLVINTSPNQPIIITENTKVVLNSRSIEIDPIEKISQIGKKIPENKIIFLKKLPADIKNYYEVRDIQEILKLYNGDNNFPINKYEDNEKRIIMVGNYYYSESKKK